MKEQSTEIVEEGFFSETKIQEKDFDYIDENYKEIFLRLKEQFKSLSPLHLLGSKRRIYFERRLGENIDLSKLGLQKRMRLKAGDLYVVEDDDVKDKDGGGIVIIKKRVLVYDTGYIASTNPVLEEVGSDYETLKTIFNEAKL